MAAKEFNNSVDVIHTPLQVQVELLKLLLEPDEAICLWNNAKSAESEVYFASREQDFTLEDWSESELATRSQAFFTQLEEIWSTNT